MIPVGLLLSQFISLLCDTAIWQESNLKEKAYICFSPHFKGVVTTEGKLRPLELSDLIRSITRRQQAGHMVLSSLDSLSLSKIQAKEWNRPQWLPPLVKGS